jgi:hypothetical protein
MSLILKMKKISSKARKTQQTKTNKKTPQLKLNTFTISMAKSFRLSSLHLLNQNLKKLLRYHSTKTI